MGSQLVNGEQIRMIQAAGGTRFLLEAEPLRRIKRNSGDDLDRHFAPETRVECAIHLSHSPGAEGRNDLVASNTRTRGQCHFRIYNICRTGSCDTNLAM